jgi:hypothetical protein
MLNAMNRTTPHKDWLAVLARCRNDGHHLLNRTADQVRTHYSNVKASNSIKNGYTKKKFRRPPGLSKAQAQVKEQEWDQLQTQIEQEYARAAQLIRKFEDAEVLERSQHSPAAAESRRKFREAASRRKEIRAGRLVQATELAYQDMENRSNIVVDLRRTSILIEKILQLIDPSFDLATLPQYVTMRIDRETMLANIQQGMSTDEAAQASMMNEDDYDEDADEDYYEMEAGDLREVDEEGSYGYDSDSDSDSDSDPDAEISDVEMESLIQEYTSDELEILRSNISELPPRMTEEY